MGPTLNPYKLIQKEIYTRLITQTEIYQAFFVLISKIMAYCSWKSKIQ